MNRSLHTVAQNSSVALTGVERHLLERIQSAFPLAENPYGRLAKDLGASRESVYKGIEDLRRNGIIRRIGASYVPARLGYVTALVAAEAIPERLADVAAHASRFAAVTHNYEREAGLNLWFTVIAPNRERLRSIVASVAAVAGVRQIHPLPAVRTFKLRVAFSFADITDQCDAAGLAIEQSGKRAESDAPLRPLAAADKRVIARTCGDIGSGLEPYELLAGELRMSQHDLLERLRGYRRAGLMRRFGAMLRHYPAGFTANGMAVWNVPDDRIADIGKRFAARPEISHCYERTRFPGWPHNLYTMIHGHQREEVHSTASELAAETGAGDYEILFSRREFKKTSMVYFAQELA